ncbi:MAG: hypothetical protein ACO1RA_21000 [Planctomycetaceae bacterium]
MKSLLITCLLSLAACANGFATDKNEKPLSVTFTQGRNGAPHQAAFIAGEPIYMNVVAKDFVTSRRGRRLSARYYIVDKDDKTLFCHAEDVTKQIFVEKSDAKLILKCPVHVMIEPGEHFFVTELHDKEMGQVYEDRQPFRILPHDEFAIGQMGFGSPVDKSVELIPTFMPGETVLLHYTLQQPQADEVGYWQISTKLRILNKAGKEVDPSSESIVSEVPADNRGVLPRSVAIKVMIGGDYVAELEVKDLIGNKVIRKTIPFHVVEYAVKTLPPPSR